MDFHNLLAPKGVLSNEIPLKKTKQVRKKTPVFKEHTTVINKAFTSFEGADVVPSPSAVILQVWILSQLKSFLEYLDQKYQGRQRMELKLQMEGIQQESSGQTESQKQACFQLVLASQSSRVRLDL